jgi:hypothetical protein
MFERFTDRARRVLVLAEEEAKSLGHDFVGTEHILLGLIREGEGVAARALESLGARLDDVREAVGKLSQPGSAQATRPRPFTPQAKKALEMSLREALKLGHNHIGTEHLLLGLSAEGEGVAARVLANLGVSVERARNTVLELLAGHGPPEEAHREEAHRGEQQELRGLSSTTRRLVGEPPVCGHCGSRLAVSARYRDVAVQPADGAKEIGEVPVVRVVYCSSCGVALGTGTGALEGAISVSKVPVPPQPAGHRNVRPFPGELPIEAVAPVKAVEVPEGHRVELTWSEGRIVEGRVAGSEVQLLGRWAHEGSAEGAWAGEALGVNWGVGASGTSQALAGELAGRFGERDVELRAGFQLSAQWYFEGGEVRGHVGVEELRATVAPAAGGLGGHGVVAEGTFGATEFELFASLSGDHARASVRGTVAGQLVRLDGERQEGTRAVRLAGEYAGPPELLALAAGALFYFM